jgi:hypothetical protein
MLKRFAKEKCPVSNMNREFFGQLLHSEREGISPWHSISLYF